MPTTHKKSVVFGPLHADTLLFWPTMSKTLGTHVIGILLDSAFSDGNRLFLF